MKTRIESAVDLRALRLMRGRGDMEPESARSLSSSIVEQLSRLYELQAHYLPLIIGSLGKEKMYLEQNGLRREGMDRSRLEEEICRAKQLKVMGTDLSLEQLEELCEHLFARRRFTLLSDAPGAASWIYGDAQSSAMAADSDGESKIHLLIFEEEEVLASPFLGGQYIGFSVTRQATRTVVVRKKVCRTVSHPLRLTTTYPFRIFLTILHELGHFFEASKELMSRELLMIRARSREDQSSRNIPGQVSELFADFGVTHPLTPIRVVRALYEGGDTDPRITDLAELSGVDLASVKRARGAVAADLLTTMLEDQVNLSGFHDIISETVMDSRGSVDFPRLFDLADRFPDMIRSILQDSISEGYAGAELEKQVLAQFRASI